MRELEISKNENDSNEVALTYSMEHESLIAAGREYIGISWVMSIQLILV